MTVAFLALALLTLLQLGLLLRLRRERAMLRHELRRVLRAGAGKVAAQSDELRWWRALGEALPQPIIVTDGQKRLLFANPPAATLFQGFQAGEFAIQRLRHHLLDEALDQALARGESEPHQFEWGGRTLHAHARAWPPNSAHAEGAILLLRDVTELQQLARARRDMAANLSHELRTPLASVKLMAETLLAGGLEQPDLAHKMVTRIAGENEALVRLIEDLTALSLLESGRSPLRLEPTDLRQLIELRLQRLAPQMEAQALRVAVEGPSYLEALLDPERFGQVITNLLDNAIKFSAPGGTLHISLDRTPQQLTLAIRDEGPGIAPRELPRIFERFYKGDRARTRSHVVGTGLGLAIAKHLVEAHGGTLDAQSRLGHGTTLRITLPSQ